MDLQAINEVKVTYQGQGYTSRSRSNQGQHQIEVIFKEIPLRGWFAFESNAFLFNVFLNFPPHSEEKMWTEGQK